MDCQELTLMSMLFETTPCKSCPTETPYQNFAFDLAKENANYKDNNEIMGKTEDTCEFSYNIRLDKVVDDAKDIGDNTGDNYINLKLQFNYLMIEIYEGRDTDKLIQLYISNV